ncbi:MAG: hypothetical protein LBL66_03785 [Clostridiales bacterium]|jgi:hypothetical protein|nr:hypothetical protein [Clostridiales bacterium]
MKALGKKEWILPDCELPPPGEGAAKGHESVIVVNAGKTNAAIRATLFFTDREPHTGIVWTVGAERVRCFRTNDPSDMGGFAVPFNTQYAVKLVSDAPVVVQYGRLDNTQSNLAFYTTLGYGG